MLRRCVPLLAPLLASAAAMRQVARARPIGRRVALGGLALAPASALAISGGGKDYAGATIKGQGPSGTEVAATPRRRRGSALANASPRRRGGGVDRRGRERIVAAAIRHSRERVDAAASRIVAV